MANLRFRDNLIANRGKIAIPVPSHMIMIAICELIRFPAVTWPRPMGLHSWCHTRVLFPVKLSLEIVCGDCARSQTQLAATRRQIQPDFICIAIFSCSAMMTAPDLAQIRFQVRRSWHFIACGFPWAIEVIEPIRACLVRASYDFIQHARTASFVWNWVSQIRKPIFRVTLFKIFFSRKFAIVWQPLNSGQLLLPNATSQ